MVWLLKVFLAVALLAVASLSAPGQDPPAPEDDTGFVSGAVVDLPSGRIVVSRTIIGKPAENRTFLRTEETKVEGTLRVGARVTVGFKETPEGEVAMRVIVRGAAAAPKKH